MRTPNDIHDEWLVLRSQQGEREALTELVDRWQMPLLRHARRLTNSADAGQEVVQEAWMAIVRGLGRLEDPARFRAWAYRIVGNKSADWIRRRQRQGSIPLNHEPSQPESLGSDAGESTLNIRRALLKLSPERRALLAMLYSDGMSVQEIAMALRLPVGTVKSRLHHARNEVKQILEREQS